ncbi:MAG: InlB B-repeat-containing protein [Clostridia bacterium]|nr:InlB B-repeat-containing protein [Clostridia bacterium]
MKKSIVKKPLSLLLSLLMALSVFAGLTFSAGAATVVETGSCGESATYTLDSDGLLTISGSGTIADNAFLNRTDIRKVVVEEGITGLSTRSFHSCDFEEISLPDSLTSYDTYAFWECRNLETLVFPKGIKTIDHYFINNGTGIKTLIIMAEDLTDFKAFTLNMTPNIETVKFAGSEEQCSRFVDDYFFNNVAVEYDYAPLDVGDTMQFGTYPQTRVTDGGLISALNAAEKTWASYEYYSGTGNAYDGQMQPGDWMRFADFFYNGEKYRAVTFDEYRPQRPGSSRNAGETQQDENGYYTGNVYYFKYEPLTWKVLDPSAGYVVCQSIVDAQMYQNLIYQSGGNYYQGVGSSNYANHYATGTLREWLNDDFYNTAFTASQKEKIKTTSQDNSGYNGVYNSAATNDKIFLLSYVDATNSAYLFSSNEDRQGTATDYTKAQGLWVSGGHSLWWLRTPSSKTKNGSYIDVYGIPTGDNENDDTLKGIRPACRLTSLANDASVSETLFSEGSVHTHTYGAPAWSWATDYSSATATLSCTECGEEQSATDNDPATVEITAASCASDRLVKYTASVTIDGTPYTTETDTVAQPGTALSHSFTPSWTWVIRPELEVIEFNIGSIANIDICPTYYQIEGQDPVAKDSAKTLYVFTGSSSGRANWIDINPDNLMTPDVYNICYRDYSVRGSNWCGGFYIGGSNCTVNMILTGNVSDYCYGYSAIGGSTEHPDEWRNKVNIYCDGATNARFEAGWNWSGYETKKVVYFTDELVQGNEYTVKVDNQLQDGFTDRIYEGYIMNINAAEDAVVPTATATAALVCPDCGRTVVLSDVAPQNASAEDPSQGRFFATVTYDGQTYTSYSAEVPVQWTQNHTVTFDPNGGEGTAIHNDYPYGKTIKLPSNTFTPPANKVFNGWLKDGTVYQPGDSYTVTGTAAFTANWTDAVYAYIAPGEAEGETVTINEVLPGTRIYLPSNPYSAPEGMLFNGWSDGENVYQSGSSYILNENTTFTAQWVQGVTVTFDSNGGSPVASQLIRPGSSASKPNAPEKEGLIFKGWRLNDAYFNFNTAVTEDITLIAVWIEAGVKTGASPVLYKGFTPIRGDIGANYSENYPSLIDGNQNTKWGRAAEYGSVEFYSSEAFFPVEYLLTTGNDSATCTGRNPRNWTLQAKLNEEDPWETIAVVSNDTVLQDRNYEQYSFPLEEIDGFYRYFRFSYNETWGHDFFQLSELQFLGYSVESFDHDLTFSAAENVLTATCSNDPCAWETNTLTLTLNAPEKAVYGDENSEFAALTDLGRFNLELGLSISENDIKYYAGETLLPVAPTTAGDYTASLTVNIDGTDYTITNAYTIAKATPEYTVPTNLTATYGDLLSSVELPEGWAWNDAPETSVGNAGENTFDAAFTPADTANYNTASETLTVAVAKAAPEYTVPEGLTVLYGKTLADIELPEGWAWNDEAETPVGCLGEHTFAATFTPADTENYNTAEAEIAFTVYTDYTFVPAKEPTCIRAGNSAYYYNPANRTYYAVTEENELAEIELYTTVIPATGHIYGTVGDARFTCTVCGYVDQGRKEDAEYEDMLPFYLESFNAAKEEVKAACDGRLQEGDSAACAALVENTKRDIDNLPYDRYKTQDENKEAVYAFLSRLNTDLANQRMADHAGACPYCGGYHHGSIIGILHAMLYVLRNFFSKLFFFI